MSEDRGVFLKHIILGIPTIEDLLFVKLMILVYEKTTHKNKMNNNF